MRLPENMRNADSGKGGRGLSKLSMRRITIGAVALSTLLILGSSICVYALAGDYKKVKNDPNFDVYLRIDKVNCNPKSFAIFQTSVKIVSKSQGDIVVLEFNVKVYSAPPSSPGSKKFGEDAVYNLTIHAKSTQIMKLNVKIYNYTDFKASNFVYVYSTIKWTHFGQYHERQEPTHFDLRMWKQMFPLP